MSEVQFPFMGKAELASISMDSRTVTEHPERLKEVMEQHGVALVTGVLDEEGCTAAEERWRSDLAALVDRKALTAAHRKSLQQLASVPSRGRTHHKLGLRAWRSEWSEHIGSAQRGFACSRGTPHSSFSWGCRTEPAVREVFAALHGTDELCVGLDNVFWQAADAAAATTNKEWLHCDQNHATGLTWPIVQGVLYVWPSDRPRASTTVVWPGSHKAEVYGRVMADPRAAQLGENSWGQLIKTNTLHESDGKALHTAAIAGSRRIPAPPGSLLLWDSRTIHQGWTGGPRLAQPVCWEPRERRDQQALRRKIWMCATGCGSSHSSTEGRVHPMAPKAPGAKLPGSTGAEPLQLPLRDTMVPFGVKPDQEIAWRAMQPALWGTKTDRRNRSNADAADTEAIRALLKEEILASL